MQKENITVLGIIKIILFAVPAAWLMLSAPTGWLYDLWAGVGTGQGQDPGEGVMQLQGQEDVSASFLAQNPATVSGHNLVPCPLVRLRDVEQAGTHYTRSRGARKQVSVPEYIGGSYPLSLWQKISQWIVGGYYNRYHLIGLEDGSYLCIYFDDYLALAGADSYPVGYVRYTTAEERRMLERMAEGYDVDPVYVLDMYQHGKASWMADILLRFVVLVAAGTVFSALLGIWKRRRAG